MMVTFRGGTRSRISQANAFTERLRERLSPGAVLRQDEPLAKRTTLRVGGPADVLVEPSSVQDLAVVLETCAQDGMPLTVIGRGSNLLIKDGGFRGVVVCLSNPSFSFIEPVGQCLRAGAGARLKQVAIEARNLNWEGFEFLEGIPGTVGGALRMNAGAMGSCLFDLVDTVQFMEMSGRVVSKAGRELGAVYRSCEFFENHIALWAMLRGRAGARVAIEERMNEFSQKRWASQPAAPSAGCMFKNPSSGAAGKLIDELGLKGLQVGGARVSQEHANFLVTDGTATAADVIKLMELVREKVKAASGITLESEVRIIGEDVANQT
jgi:UDP-N-acetylenolpyruvoylglucosamine reductase